MAGTLTRLQMVTEVADIVGKSTNAASLSGATLKSRIEDRYINWAQKRIARFHNFHELNTSKTDAATVASIKKYPMVTGTNNLGLTRPKDISSIILIDGSNSRRLIRMNHVNFEKRIPRPENYSEGRSSLYHRWGNDLYLFRVPDAAYTLQILYPQWPVDLTTDGQTTDFDNKDQLLVTATVMETYLALEEYADVAIWYPKVIGMLRDARAVEGDTDWEPQAEPFKIQGEVGSGEPWLEPGAVYGDPLYGFPEG